VPHCPAAFAYSVQRCSFTTADKTYRMRGKKVDLETRSS
jgi:hypothetical protein